MKYQSLKSYSKGVFLIIRPHNSFLAGFSIVIGVLASITRVDVLFQQDQFLWKALLGYLTTFFIAAAGYVINDVYDVDIDRLNQPHRPLPSGMLSIRQARILAFLLFLLGIGSGFSLGIPLGSVAITAGVTLYLYARKYKKSGLIGNVMVAALTAFPFIVGGLLAESEFLRYMIPATFAFLLILGREIIKDIEDVPGDKLENVKSLAILISPRFARNIASIILSFLVLLSFLPLVLEIYQNMIWYASMVLVVDILILFSLGNLYHDISDDETLIQNSTLSKKILKISIFVGIFGFILMPFV